MNILFLDDDPKRTKAFRSQCPKATCVETADACLQKLREQQWDVIFLDHDLNGEHYVNSGRNDCGMEVVRNLVSNPCHSISGTTVVVHSYNLAASIEMANRLNQAGYEGCRLPFGLRGFTAFVAGLEAQP